MARHLSVGHPRRWLVAASLVVALALTMMAGNASGEEVVLNPGNIAGTIQMGDQRIREARVSASFESFSASERFSALNATSVDYDLTVNVPQGTTPSYSVGLKLIMTNNGSTTFTEKIVPVAEFQTSTVDFGTTNPALVQGTVTVNGGTLDIATVRVTPSTIASGFKTAGTEVKRTRRLCDGTGSNAYCLAVFPDSNTRVTASIRTVGGQDIFVEKFVSLAAGINTVDFTVDFVPIPVGNIAGTITVNGPKPIVQHKIEAVFCPSFQEVTLNANGPYLFSDLGEGPCTMRAFTQYDNTGTSFSFSGTNFRYPQSAFSDNAGRPTVISGETITVDINSDQSFLQGNFSVSGTKSLSEVASLDTIAFGVSGSPSDGGRGFDTVDLQTGAYELVLSPGAWRNFSTFWSFRNFSSDPAEFLNESLAYQDSKMRDDPEFFTNLVAGQTVTQNFNHKFGDVTITFSVVGGGLLSSPRVRTFSGASCIKRDDSNQLLYRYSINSSSFLQQDVQQGIVNFTGPEATCTLTADALVDGSRVTFGQFTVDVVAGAEIIVDIGGPTLDVQFPLPDEVIDATSIAVTGTVTDDVEVASVTVNGVAASLASTNNPNDPVEVSFSATIPIVKGPNQVVTVATDTSDKTAQDTRTVFSDSGAPHLTFTPADGTVTSATGITVEGVASNDAGVASVTVNGVSVTLTPTGNPNDFTEVSFSTPLTLQLGANPITVVATDISNLTVSETHTVTVSDNQAPVCEDQDIDVDEDGLAVVRLDCSDADQGDTIEVELVALNLVGMEPIDISGSSPDFDVIVMPQSDFNGSGGSFTFQATDSSGAMSAEATATITVNPVNDPPVITGLPTSLTIDEGESSLLELDPSVTDVETAAGDMSWTGTSSASTVADVGISATRVATINAIDGGSNADVTLAVTDRGDPDNCGAPSATCDGSESTAHSIAITVNNVAPTITSLTVPLAPVNINDQSSC